MRIRDKGLIILVNPGPLNYDFRYPIPISLMEDVQQHNFWDVGVRNLGIQLIYYRVFKVGTRINYIWNEDKRRLVWEYPGYTKERSASIRTTIDQSVTTTASHVHLATLTPEQRILAEFGHSLMLSSSRESRFWEESKNKSDAMNNINEILYRDPKIRTPAQGLGVIFNSVLPQAIQNHENMVTLTIDMENEKESLNSERRKSLLVWNKGTTSFVRRMIKEVQDDNPDTPIPEAERFLIKLEKERLRLSNPNPAGDTTDSDELEFLKLQRCKQVLTTSDPAMAVNQEMETLANAVLEDEDSTLFSIACAKILLAVLGRKIVQGWIERARVGGEAMTTFAALVEVSTVGDIWVFWKAEMNAWQAMLMQVARDGPPKA